MFQPELRRALERFGGKSVRELLNGKSPRGEMEEAILATVSACEIMSKERVGVLLIFERETSLEEYFKPAPFSTPVPLSSCCAISSSPRPLFTTAQSSSRRPRDCGGLCDAPFRESPSQQRPGHPAPRCVGTSEVSDAVVVIVSEETGTISVAIGGMLKRHLAPQTLERLLTSELVPNEEEQKTLMKRVKQFGRRRDDPMRNKKWLAMLLSLVVSVGIWVYIVTVENPERDQTLYNIPVVFTGEDILREDYDLIISESNVASGVTLTFYGKNSELISSWTTRWSWRWRSTSPACAAPRSFPSRMI